MVALKQKQAISGIGKWWWQNEITRRRKLITRRVSAIGHGSKNITVLMWLIAGMAHQKPNELQYKREHVALSCVIYEHGKTNNKQTHGMA